jgi:hypothetical protein
MARNYFFLQKSSNYHPSCSFLADAGAQKVTQWFIFLTAAGWWNWKRSGQLDLHRTLLCARWAWGRVAAASWMVNGASVVGTVWSWHPKISSRVVHPNCPRMIHVKRGDLRQPVSLLVFDIYIYNIIHIHIHDIHIHNNIHIHMHNIHIHNIHIHIYLYKV